MATTKQKKAIKLITTKGNNISQAMAKAGYSPSVRTTQLTKSKAFIETMEKLGLTDEYLGKHLRQGLKAKTPTGAKDWANRHKYFDSAVKLRGYYDNAQGSSSANITIVNPLAVQLNNNQDNNLTEQSS